MCINLKKSSDADRTDDIPPHNHRQTVSSSSCGASLVRVVAGGQIQGKEMATEVHQTDARDRDAQQTNSFYKRGKTSQAINYTNPAAKKYN